MQAKSDRQDPQQTAWETVRFVTATTPEGLVFARLEMPRAAPCRAAMQASNGGLAYKTSPTAGFRLV